MSCCAREQSRESGEHCAHCVGDSAPQRSRILTDAPYRRRCFFAINQFLLIPKVGRNILNILNSINDNNNNQVTNADHFFHLLYHYASLVRKMHL